MRRSLAALLLAAPLALAACGEETDEVLETELTVTESASTPEVEPYGARKTCAQLYRPPAQLMPRAIELVHGSPSAEDASAAEELAAGLAEAEARALDPLAEDIAVVIAGLEAIDAGATPDVAAFDKAVNALGRDCEIYND